jgi:NAD(P)-dependent dehydrogenase (short-subunit alcohol dehydrogenase family)
MNVLAITGGSTGIGAAISERFLNGGWIVVSGSRTERQLSANQNGNFHHLNLDVNERQSLFSFVDSASEFTGKIDCFINNSGFSEWKPIQDIDEIFLNQILQTNLMGYFWGSQAALNRLGPDGSIINISSLAARRGTANNSAYVASKFGVAGLTQSLAKELGPKGIRVNAVCPVLVKTDGLIQALSDPKSPAAGNPDLFLEKFAREQTALGFLPTAKDVANLCFFLAGSESRAITGQSISVDCGVLPN